MAEVTSYAKYAGARYPAESDVREWEAYGDTNTQLVGVLDVSDENPIYPGQSDVRLGVTYGTQTDPDKYTGNVRVPPASEVRLGYDFDSLDQVTGTLDTTADFPTEGDVREGVTFDEGDRTGNLVIPIESTVQEGVLYGALGIEFTGTYTIDTNVVSAEMYIIRGDSYVGGDAFKWTSDEWPDLTGASIIWELVYEEEKSMLSKSAAYADGEVTLELLASDTSHLASRVYRYGLRATLADGQVKTLARGFVWLSMAYATPSP